MLNALEKSNIGKYLIYLQNTKFNIGIINSIFIDVCNNTNNSLFSIITSEDGKDIEIEMINLKIIPSNYFHIKPSKYSIINKLYSYIFK